MPRYDLTDLRVSQYAERVSTLHSDARGWIMEQNPDDRRPDGTKTEKEGEDTPDYPVTKITKDEPDADRKAEPAKTVER